MKRREYVYTFPRLQGRPFTELSQSEMEFCRRVGEERYRIARRNCSRENIKSSLDPVEISVHGAKGEFVVHKYFGIPWVPVYQDPKDFAGRGDIVIGGLVVDVKCPSIAMHMSVAQRQVREHRIDRYILVWGEPTDGKEEPGVNNVFTIVGSASREFVKLSKHRQEHDGSYKVNWRDMLPV